MRQEGVGSPADPVETKIAGDAQERRKIARAAGRPGEQLILAGQGGDGRQRIAEQALFEEAAEFAQQGEQPDALTGRDRPRAAARLDGQRMRPAPCQETHQFEKVGPGRQHLGGRRAAQGSEALRGGRMPRPAGVGGAGEIGHEEQVEVGQMVGQVFGGLDQLPR